MATDRLRVATGLRVTTDRHRALALRHDPKTTRTAPPDEVAADHRPTDSAPALPTTTSDRLRPADAVPVAAKAPSPTPNYSRPHRRANATPPQPRRVHNFGPWPAPPPGAPDFPGLRATPDRARPHLLPAIKPPSVRKLVFTGP